MEMNYKALPLNEAEIKADDETGVFSGYASVFNGVDSYGDTILPGAYQNVLKDRVPKMFLNHNSMALPIGKWKELREDEKGLFVVGELTKGNPEAEAVLAALKHGTLDGLSIGYRLSQGDFKVTKEGREIKNISKLFEISVVTFPADDAARIEDVKNEEHEEIKTERDFDRYLRDSGFSRSKALEVTFLAKKVFSKEQALTDAQGDPDGKEKALKEISDRLKDVGKLFEIKP